MPPARTSPSWKPLLEACVARLRATAGIEITAATIGRPCPPAALAKANALVPGGLGPTLTSLYAAANGFRIVWTGGGQVGELGVVPLDALIGKGSATAFEDQLWNDEFVDQFDGSAKAAAAALAKVQAHRLLWSDEQGRGLFTSLALSRGTATVFVGETNAPRELDITLAAYLEASIACAGLDVGPCFVGKAAERKAAGVALAGALDAALPGWPRPGFLPRAPKPAKASAPKAAKAPAPKGPAPKGARVAAAAYPPVDAAPVIVLDNGKVSSAPEIVRFSADGAWLVALGHGRLCVVGVATRKLAWEIKAGVRAFALAADGETLAVAESRSAKQSSGELLVRRRLADGDKIGPPWTSKAGGGIEHLAYRDDGRELAANIGGAIHCLDPATLEVTRTLAHRGEVDDLTYVAGAADRLLVRAGALEASPSVRVHDLASGTVVFTVAAGAGTSRVGAAGRPDGAQLAVAGTACVLVDARTGAPTRELPGALVGTRNRRCAVAYAPDGARLAVAESADDVETVIRIVDVETGAVSATLGLGGDSFSGAPITAFDLAISRDNLLAVATHSNGVRLWRLA